MSLTIWRRETSWFDPGGGLLTDQIFEVGTGANGANPTDDDQYVQRQSAAGAAYSTIPSATLTRARTANVMGVERSYDSVATTYLVREGLLSFDTSPLSDGDPATSAALRIVPSGITSQDNLALCGEYYLWDLTDADWIATPAMTAFDPIPLSSIPGGGTTFYDIALKTPGTSISRTGRTGIRLFLTQLAGNAAPAGANRINIRTFDYDAANLTDYAPRLLVSTVVELEEGSPLKLTATGNLQTQINALGAGGGTIVLSEPNVVYRDDIDISTPVDLTFAAGAELRGSDVWNSNGTVARNGTGATNTWTSLGGGLYRSSAAVPALQDPNGRHEEIVALTASSAIGATTVTTANASNAKLYVGREVALGESNTDASTYEYARIISKNTTTNTVTFAAALTKAHTATHAILYAEPAWPEQVFVNGGALDQKGVTDTSTLAATEFRLNGSRQVVLAFDPVASSALVEVTARNYWIKGASGSAATRLRNISARHSANDGLSSGQQANWKVYDFDISWSHTAGAAMSQNTGLLLQRGRAHHCGQLGVQSSGAKIEVDSVEIDHNCREMFRSGWAGGGIKIATADWCDVHDCEVHDNRGYGIWTDVTNPTQGTGVEGRMQIRSNSSHHNADQGIRIEVTINTDVSLNASYENGWGDDGKTVNAGGMGISASSYIDTWGNVVAWNALSEMVFVQQRRDDTRPEDIAYNTQRNCRHWDNTLVTFQRPDIPNPDNRQALAWRKDTNAVAAGAPTIYASPGNSGLDVRVYFSDVDGNPISETVNTVNRYKASDAGLQKTVAELNATALEEGAALITKAQMEAKLSAYGIPIRPETRLDPTGLRANSTLSIYSLSSYRIATVSA